MRVLAVVVGSLIAVTAAAEGRCADFGQFVVATQTCQEALAQKAEDRTESKIAALFMKAGLKQSGSTKAEGGDQVISFTPTGVPLDQPSVEVKTIGTASFSRCTVLMLGNSQYVDALHGAMARKPSPWRQVGIDNDADLGQGAIFEWKKNREPLKATVHSGALKGTPIGVIVYENERQAR